MTVRNINEVLTADLFKVIFSKLPFSNFTICRIVCKAWNLLVLDYTQSSKFHHKKSLLVFTSEAIPNPGPRVYPFCNPMVHSMDFGTNINFVASFKFGDDWNTVSYVCSCNGLLYITKSTLEHWCDVIWNPMTNESIQLPKIEGDDSYFYGFGFSPKTNQYKMVGVDSSHESLGTKIEIWRFGTRNELQLWEHIGWHSPPDCFVTDGVYLDGVIYWIARVITDRKKKTKHVYFIHAFDVETETFETRYPSDIGPCSNIDFGIQLMSVNGKLKVIIGPCITTAFKIQLKSFNGHLGLIITMFKPVWKVCVWIMRERAWIREFVIDIPIHEPKNVYFVEATKCEISLLINDNFYIFGKNGNIKIKIKTSLNTNGIGIREDVPCIESFQFGHLSRILNENY